MRIRQSRFKTIHMIKILVNIIGTRSDTLWSKYDFPRSVEMEGSILSGLTIHVPMVLKKSDPSPMQQELMPEPRPGLLGITWKVMVRLPVI